MALPEKSKTRIKEFYREVEGISLPINLVFDPEYNPSEKLVLSLICQLVWLKAEETKGQFWTDFTNGELNRILGGVSVRSLHRHFQKYQRKGLIKVVIVNTPRPNYRKIHLTPKGIKYFFGIDVGESTTVSNVYGEVTYE